MKHTWRVVLVVLLIGILGTAGCSSTATKVPLKMAPLSELPEKLQKAPLPIRESYQFALANPDVLEKIPCYCGCGAMGHENNYDCYIAEITADGKVVFDDHAYG